MKVFYYKFILIKTKMFFFFLIIPIKNGIEELSKFWLLLSTFSTIQKNIIYL